MSQFYALMPDNTVKYISLKEEIIQDVKNKFIEGATTLKPEGVEEDEFNGDILARNGENITFVNYILPEGFKRIPDNQADMSEFDIEEDMPKSIFWYENGKYFFQVFNRRNLLQRKTILKIEYGKTFSKMSESAFIIEDKINAIYENGKLYFQNYTSANQIFSLIDFVTEATNGEIDTFSENDTLDVNAERVKEIGNIKTRRLIKVLSQNNNVATFMTKSPRMRTSLLKKHSVNATIDANGRLILPTNKVTELNRVLAFLNEDLFRGVITDSLYRSNSKKKD
jgi:hypothetical protein